MPPASFRSLGVSEAESGMVTRALVPLKTRASPYLPEVVQVALVIVPLLPFPETSARTEPLPAPEAVGCNQPSAQETPFLEPLELKLKPETSTAVSARTR